MLALYFNGNLEIRNVPPPVRKRGEALIRVKMAGICSTDHEIVRGYVKGYQGVLGHEFIGYVKECDTPSLVCKRVSAEINIPCKTCSACIEGLERHGHVPSNHCPNRQVLGIRNKDGAFCELITMPLENIYEIPDAIRDQEAIFIEPLAASLAIQDSVDITKSSNVLIIGDGKLSLMIALALKPTGCNLTVVGKHDAKLEFFNDVNTINLQYFNDYNYDIVVEASGSPDGLGLAIKSVRPRGSIVLKSTYNHNVSIDPSFFVVNEIRLIGSRCGSFKKAIDFLLNNPVNLENFISAEFPLKDAISAFEYSLKKDSLKVLIKGPPI